MTADFYIKGPVDKRAMLKSIKAKLGLRYKLTGKGMAINATESKEHYYSLNKKAVYFRYVVMLTSIICIEK
jgi:hypothetical protein